MDEEEDDDLVWLIELDDFVTEILDEDDLVALTELDDLV